MDSGRIPTLFEAKVYKACSLVPKGKVTTYGAIAKKLKTNACRAVGSALNKNPYAPKVPCHRVVNSDGNIGGFASGCDNKIRLLKKEGIIRAQVSLVDYEKLGYDVQVIIQLKVSKGKLFEVEGKIASDRHVFAIYDQTGQYDATILARFKTRRELDGFLKKIQTYPFIEDTETSLVLNVMKENPVSVFD